MNTEQLIKDAFGVQAERAPDAGPLLMKLRRTRAIQRSHWRRRTALTLAAAGVVTAVAVPTVLRSDATTSPADTSAVSQPSSGTAEEAGQPATPMRFTVGWLPAGFGEEARIVRVDNGPGALVERTWRSLPMRNIDDPYLRLLVYPAGAAMPPGEPVDVNGARGVITDRAPGDTDADPNFRWVWWSPDGQHVLVVVTFGVPDSTAAAVRAARSVVADTAALEPAATFGWLPASLRASRQSVVGWSSADWSFELTAVAGPAAPAPRLTVYISRLALLWKGPEVTVRGRAGMFRHWEGSNEVVVDFDGHRLTVTGEFPIPDLVRVADTLVVHPVSGSGYDWIGAR